MKKYLILTLSLLILNILYLQGKPNSLLILNDSVVISHRHFVAATQAFIQLRNLKKEQGLCQDLVHNKDVTIQYYERLYKKCNQSDSITTILLVNKDKEIVIKDNLISDYKYQNRANKAKKIGLGIAVPVAAVLSFLLGWYLHQ